MLLRVCMSHIHKVMNIYSIACKFYSDLYSCTQLCFCNYYDFQCEFPFQMVSMIFFIKIHQMIMM